MRVLRGAAPAVMAPDDPCPSCAAPATRPDIVWFGEMPHELDRIFDALEAAEVFAAIGTSGQVYPAAGFVDVAARHGAQTWELTLAPSGNPMFDEIRAGPATETVPEWCAAMAARFGA